MATLPVVHIRPGMLAMRTRLLNRRVLLIRGANGWAIKCKRLEGRKAVETKIAFTDEAMEAIVSMFLQFKEDGNDVPAVFDGD